MRRDFKSDIEKGIYTNDDNSASLIPYLLGGTAYSLQIDAEPLFRKYIAAAILKYRDKEIPYEDVLKSIDISDYSDDNSRNQFELVRHLIVDNAVMAQKIISNYYEDNSENNFMKQLFVLSLGRLSSSFKSAALLLNNGFFVEVICIFRLIIEQLAWGCYLLTERDKSKIKNNRTQSNIKYLKEELGEEYGTLYGYLSSEAHLEPGEICKYLQQSENAIAVRGRSEKDCEEDTGTFLMLLRAYGDVIWKGMNYFGISDDDMLYYQDWYKLHQSFIAQMKAVLDGKAKYINVGGKSPL